MSRVAPKPRSDRSATAPAERAAGLRRRSPIANDAGSGSEGFVDVVQLLGGEGVVFRKHRTKLHSKVDVHEIVSGGLSPRALSYVMGRSVSFRQEDFANAIGMSVRTLQRLSATTKRLTAEQSSRTWKFAEILAKATEVLGSRSEAERWLKTPSMALDQRRPVDLLKTGPGTEAVEQLLGRLEYGVYT